MNSNKIIKIDCDGVLRNMLPAMCSIYNDYYDTDLRPKDVTDFDISKIFNKCSEPEDFFFRKHITYIYLNARVCKKAKEAMDMLHEKGYHIAIVSDQPTFDRQYYTLEWLRLNNIYYDSICFTKDKGILSGDIVVDDYVGNLIKCNESEKILIDAPYNRYENRFKKFSSLFEYADSLNDISNDFKNGDIVYVKTSCEWLIIYKEKHDGKLYKYVSKSVGSLDISKSNIALCDINDIKEMRIATESERKELFIAMECNKIIKNSIYGVKVKYELENNIETLNN